ncbi:hypothetical protein SAMN05444416_105157 [Thermoactinomyces sp. DSM 45892]|nr:hypothetical protein SAMN05444416_105157 [Thermoactinomyces sp. DSM 45892]
MTLKKPDFSLSEKSRVFSGYYSFNQELASFIAPLADSVTASAVMTNVSGNPLSCKVYVLFSHVSSCYLI